MPDDRRAGPTYDLSLAGALNLDDPNVVRGAYDDEVRGVSVRIFLRIGLEGRIVEARYQVFGCAASIACASELARWLPGLTLKEAGQLRPMGLIEALSLPEQRAYAAEVALSALGAAITTWERRSDG